MLKKLLNHISKSKPHGFDSEYHHTTEGFDVLLEKINTYFSAHNEECKKYIGELFYLNKKLNNLTPENKLLYAVMPYDFTAKYNYDDVEVFKDEASGMFYVYLEDKKLYYHKGYDNKLAVQKSFTYVSAEQDKESPHRYLDDFFTVNDDDVVVDLGAAEGNFSLMVVDKVKELIIVEADHVWIEALHKTFEPWKEKVTIIHKSAGNSNDENTISLDELIDKKKVNTVKMDIEGAEVDVLKYATSSLQNNIVKLAVTTYHRQSDANTLQSFFEENNYETAFSNNFMLFVYDNLLPPYFRKGLIKAIKR